MVVPMLPAPPVTTATPASPRNLSEGIIDVSFHLLNAPIIYFHSGVQLCDLFQNRFADWRSTLFQNKVANHMDRQPELALAQEFIEEFKETFTMLGNHQRPKRSQS
jgi:hypothetical protein